MQLNSRRTRKSLKARTRQARLRNEVALPEDDVLFARSTQLIDQPDEVRHLRLAIKLAGQCEELHSHLISLWQVTHATRHGHMQTGNGAAVTDHITDALTAQAKTNERNTTMSRVYRRQQPQHSRRLPKRIRFELWANDGCIRPHPSGKHCRWQPYVGDAENVIASLTAAVQPDDRRMFGAGLPKLQTFEACEVDCGRNY